jgi:hypothetical protein
MGTVKLFKEYDMSKYIQVTFLALGLMLLSTNVWADEVTKSTSTRVENPDYNSSSSSTTTTENNPAAVKQESTSTEVSPGREVTTSKKVYIPKVKRTVTKHTEIETNP